MTPKGGSIPKIAPGQPGNGWFRHADTVYELFQLFCFWSKLPFLLNPLLGCAFLPLYKPGRGIKSRHCCYSYQGSDCPMFWLSTLRIHPDCVSAFRSPRYWGNPWSRFLLITRTRDGLSPVPLGEKCKAHTEQGWVKCRPVIRSGTQPHKKHWRILLCSFLCVSSSSVSLQIPLWTTSSFCMASASSRSTLTCDACSLSSSSL